MSYKSSGIIVSGVQYDRRQKLTPFQEVKIFHRYMTETTSRCQLVQEYGVSRRLITFIVDPKSEERNKELLRESKAKGLYKYDRRKHTENIHNHRRYERRLSQEGKIILKDRQTMGTQEKQKALGQEVIANLCVTPKMSKNMLPYTVYVEEERENGYDHGVPIYIMYRSEEVHMDGSHTLCNAESWECFTCRYLHKTNTDRLVTAWERHPELCVEQDTWKGNVVAFLKDRTNKPEEGIISFMETSWDGHQAYTDDLKAFLGEDKDREIWIFSFPLDGFERDVPAGRTIIDYENNPATRVRKMTPLEFTANINDECFDDRNNWARAVELPEQGQ